MSLAEVPSGGGGFAKSSSRVGGFSRGGGGVGAFSGAGASVVSLVHAAAKRAINQLRIEPSSWEGAVCQTGRTHGKREDRLAAGGPVAFVVLKFGGTSVSSLSRWETIARQIVSNRVEG